MGYPSRYHHSMSPSIPWKGTRWLFGMKVGLALGGGTGGGSQGWGKGGSAELVEPWGLRGAAGGADRHPLNAKGRGMGLLGPGNLTMRPTEAIPLRRNGAQGSCWGSECSHCGFGWFWGGTGARLGHASLLPRQRSWASGATGGQGAIMAYLTPMSHPFLTEAV